MPLTLFKYWTYQFFAPGVLAKKKYEAFKRILIADKEAHVFLARLEEIFYKKEEVDCFLVYTVFESLSKAVSEMVEALIELSPLKYGNLKDYFRKIDFYCRFLLEPKYYNISPPFTAAPGLSDNVNDSLLGGKGYNLYRLVRELGLPVPDFFVITTNSFFYLIECLDMLPVIKEELARVDIKDPESLKWCSNKILDHFRSSDIPLALCSEIKTALEKTFASTSKLKFSVRSSAVAEDSTSSFAGQYLSVIGAHAKDIKISYKKVIESKYTPNAIYYRIKKGYCDLETPMAAIVQKMIDPLCAGVAYSRDPEKEQDDFICIYATQGQGEQVVSGKVRPAQIMVNRHSMNVASMERGPLCSKLNEGLARELAKWILKIEKLLEAPVDMEWCIDQKGELKVLQARPLSLESGDKKTKERQRLPKGLTPILTGGQNASGGCAFGRVHKVFSKGDLYRIQEGGVLVSRTAPPDYVVVFDKIKAMITEEGSPASHCASVAREMGIPYICGMNDALSMLKNDEPVTVDADNCRVYHGRAGECEEKSSLKGREQEEKRPIFSMLKQLIKLACHLDLVDPDSPDFRPEGCRSLHDIIRFCHETSMREMFSLGSKGSITGKGTKRLRDGLPLVFFVLDVGGGIKDEAEGLEEISIEYISSVPMQAFWKGLTDPSIRWSEAEHFAWGDYDNIMLAGGVVSKDSAQLSSYAVVARDYMNLNVRFGYHFVQIDALCTENSQANYITFRFSGGGGAPEGRLLRTQFLIHILRSLGFEAESTGELVDGKITQLSKEDAKKILKEIGRLVGATRLMDMYLRPEIDVKALAEEFLRGRSDFSSSFEEDQNGL